MRFLLLFASALILTGNVVAQNSYNNSTYNLNINFPDGWKQQPAWSNNEIQKARLYNTDAEIVTIIALAVYPSTKEEVNGVNGSGASKAWDSQKKRFGQDAQDLKESGSALVAGMSMKWATTYYDLFGKHTFTKTYYFGKGDRIYRFTLQSNGGKTVFDAALPLFEEAMKSLKV